MANYTVPSPRGREVPVQTQDRDHLSALDVVWANKYESEKINTTHAKNMEFEFFRGAPPRWLNFYWAEHQNSPFVKRDLYEELKRKIHETKMKRWSIAHINLFHVPGTGGSTVAMQVLWDLRKKLRCAKLLDSITDTKAIAQQVLRLFRAGGPQNQNTVLLLLDKKYIIEDALFQENLEQNLCDEIKAKNITDTIPVVIILNCLHQTKDTDSTKDKNTKSQNLTLFSNLSQNERDTFNNFENSDTIQRHGNQLYAFNIMVNNYDPSYVTNICEDLISQDLKKKRRRARKQQLLAFLALINLYVPGSVLPYDLCLKFIEGECNDLDHFSLEDHMQPFTNFLAIFSAKEEEVNSEDKHVRMVHPMIAHECLKLLTEAGVTRSDTTLNLMKELCKDKMPLCLVKIIKKLLTKRESRLQESDQTSNLTLDKFSKLILDIQKEENPSMCVAVLKMASKKFSTDPYFPQVLARFYYIKMKNYGSAIHWAKMAIRRDEKNSFIRDTLGQVYKNCLKNLKKWENNDAHARKILQLGKKATEVFKAEEQVALEEEAPEMQEHGLTSTSTIFNIHFFGYMKVAKIIFDHMESLHEEWPRVLTKEITPHRFLNTYDNGRCEKYKSFITCLRDEVEDKFYFFECYFLYSKPSIHKDEPKYFWPELDLCYSNFVKQGQKNKSAFQILKEKKASTFAGLLRTINDPELELITEQWKEIHSASPSDAEIIQNYIVANVMLSQRNDTSLALKPLEDIQAMLHSLWTEQKDRRSPEFYLLVLLLFWPDAQQRRHNSVDIAECVRYMHDSFKRTYKNYLRGRYLVPLFFLKTGDGLKRFILAKGHAIDTDLRVRGEVQNHTLYFVQGSEWIEVSPAHPASMHGQGQVSFHLGFNIRGPVAYNIIYEYKKAEDE